MTGRTFRRLALSLEGAAEGAHMCHPDFRAHGRIFATLDAAEREGHVKLTPEQQAELMTSRPEVFAPASGAWGHQGWTRVHLQPADEEAIGEALTLAWRNVSAKRARTKRPSRG